ncbi:MAG TPA: TetR/AcrR family transcriptional regulator [Actinomycetes bacterium]|nr:TetR/AcrR family transcriptional regulator [Actinomycetes bacterium]
MTSVSTTLDRRQRRRQETIAEVVDVAAKIMAEQGVVGLSVGEVARRMGIRPPSLYVYFPSKHALYDALFARGAQEVLDHVRSDDLGRSEDQRLDEVLLHVAETFVRWSVEHPAYTALLFWRPVPGFAPSAEAYAPAVELVELTRARFADLQDHGLLRADAEIDEVQRDWTVLISGVISQQLSNAPGEPLAEGRFTSALPTLVAMFARHYGAVTLTTSLHPKENRRVRTR